MTWAAGRAKLVTAFEAIAGIEKCHEFPPGTLQDLAAVVIIPPARATVRGSSIAGDRYALRCRVHVSDQDMDQAAEAADDLSELMLRKFDAQVALGGDIAVIEAQEHGEIGQVEYGGKKYVGFDVALTLRIITGKDYTA